MNSRGNLAAGGGGFLSRPGLLNKNKGSGGGGVKGDVEAEQPVSPPRFHDAKSLEAGNIVLEPGSPRRDNVLSPGQYPSGHSSSKKPALFRAQTSSRSSFFGSRSFLARGRGSIDGKGLEQALRAQFSSEELPSASFS
ncbi:unnamed protein product, partial [Amoebophrya sp. A25]|eukprot:GSA25T00025345001.1